MSSKALSGSGLPTLGEVIAFVHSLAKGSLELRKVRSVVWHRIADADVDQEVLSTLRELGLKRGEEVVRRAWTVRKREIKAANGASATAKAKAKAKPASAASPPKAKAAKAKGEAKPQVSKAAAEQHPQHH